jgi:hypothetical protein
VESGRNSTHSPRIPQTDADGNRTRLGALALASVLKTRGWPFATVLPARRCWAARLLVLGVR